jgi:hypothetical protein
LNVVLHDQLPDDKPERRVISGIPEETIRGVNSTINIEE